MTLSPELTQILKNIQLLATDVDGVLTRGEITYTASGEEIKSFDVKDGHGIAMWTKLHSKPCAIITARTSAVVEKRGQELGIQYILQGRKQKLDALNTLCNELNIPLEAVCYIGDDTPDLGVLKSVGFSVCPSDAVDEIKTVVNYVTQKKGGRGAVRELLDMIFEAQGLSKV
jgi:3-deoxy-D-manno-octulosonate 8-phosphate phosphatase (KDO 8-P phosphatase)